MGAEGDDLDALAGLANDLRRYTVGEAISFVVNRNVTSTNLSPTTPPAFVDRRAVVRTSMPSRPTTMLADEAATPSAESSTNSPESRRTWAVSDDSTGASTGRRGAVGRCPHLAGEVGALARRVVAGRAQRSRLRGVDGR